MEVHLSDDEFIDVAVDGRQLLHGVADHSKGSFSLKELEEVKYDDFHTIDWHENFQRNRFRHRQIVLKSKKSYSGLFYYAFDSSSAWVCIFIVGLLCGLVAAYIDMAYVWLGSLVHGVCKADVLLPRRDCCWGVNNTLALEECPEWVSWGQLAGRGENYGINYFMFCFLSIIYTSFAAMMVKFFAPYACGSGIPEMKTILSGYIIRGYLSSWTFVIKSFGIVLSSAGGLSLGKEGPFVQICSSIANLVSKLFPKFKRNEVKKREVLSSAVAAGVSVAFGAPVGGVLFSLEEVSYYFPLKTLWRSFFCALVAAFSLHLSGVNRGKQDILFFIGYDDPTNYIELVPFIFIGIIGGFYGVLFIRLNVRYCAYRKSSFVGRFPITEVMVVTLVTVLLSYPFLFTRQDTNSFIRQLFSKCRVGDSTPLCDYKWDYSNLEGHQGNPELGDGIYRTMWQLVVILVLKFVFTCFTFGLKVPAGLFIPTICAGAIIGRIVGIGVQQIARQYSIYFMHSLSSMISINPGVYALVGAAATLGGVTRMTVSLVVIMYEMTAGISYIIPIMVATMISKWIADWFGKEGIYDQHIHLNCFPFLDGKEEISESGTAHDVLHSLKEDASDLTVIEQNKMTIAEIKTILDDTSYNGFPVVVSRHCRVLAGFVYRRDLEFAIQRLSSVPDSTIVYFSGPRPEQYKSTRLSLILDQSPMTVTVFASIHVVLEMFQKLGIRQLLVTKNNEVVGIITKKDFVQYIGDLRAMRTSLLANN